MDTLIITHEQAGGRIDKLLAEIFSSYSRGELIRRIKTGEVTVNAKAAKPSYELKEGDSVAVMFSLQSETITANPAVSINVIYEDKNIIVVNKPTGLQVHPSDKKETGTLVNGLIARFPEIISVHDDSISGEFRPGIVHRLDKDTSGVMVVARTQKAFEALKKIFKKRLVQKHYVAIVHGTPEEKTGIIDKPIARASSYRKQIIAKKNTKTIIREAITEYNVKKTIGDYSVVDVFPKTGRMHQIRVHLASIGHPIVGDVRYVSNNLTNLTRKLAPHHLLHAYAITFTLFGKKYSFESALPEDFEAFIRSIDENKQS